MSTDGSMTSPLLEAVMHRKSYRIMLALLSASFTMPCNPNPVNILYQCCKAWSCQEKLPQLKEQNVKRWAKEWEEHGSHLFEKDHYTGVMFELEKAEKGEKEKKCHLPE